MADQVVDPALLHAFANPAAGHDGTLVDASGEVFVKPCTQAEIDFYEQTLAEYPEFIDLMPLYMGSLQLGAANKLLEAAGSQGQVSDLKEAEANTSTAKTHRILSETGIALENLEYLFQRPNVLDIKLGAKLYAPGTAADKAERLDKVAKETTSGSLHFRIAGMKVWNGHDYDVYDKFYGRQFHANDVHDGLATFFSGLAASLGPTDARELLQTISAEISKIRHLLEKYESRMYSTSVLIVYEGDGDSLRSVMSNDEPDASHRNGAASLAENATNIGEEDDEDDEDEESPVAFRVKLIDFAHSAWTLGEGKDDNVIEGLQNVEAQLDKLVQNLNGDHYRPGKRSPDSVTW